MIEQSLRDPDILVRSMALEHTHHLDEQDRIKVLEIAFSDPHFHVRQRALDQLSRAPYARGSPLFTHALFDSSGAIRQTARSILKRNEEHRERKYFLDLAFQELQNPDSQRLAGALRIIGEIGEAGDALIIERFLTHRFASVRAAALFGLSQTQPRAYEEHFWRIFLEDRPKVSRQAARALLKIHSHSIGDRLWSYFQSCSDAKRKKNILWFLHQLPKWEKFSYLILALGDAHPDVRDRAEGYLRAWMKVFNRIVSFPNEVECQKTREAFSSVKRKIPESLRVTLEFYMKGLMPSASGALKT